MTDPGFWLRINGTWVGLPGVQAGVPVRRNRNRSSLQTVGGYNYEYQSKRAPREWTLDFTNATPAAMAAMMLAANGQAGEVWMMSGADARANMLDPLKCVGPDTYPLLDCGGLPLRSVTSGAGLSATVEVLSSANITLISPSSNTNGLRFQTGTTESLIKFPVPATPADRTLTSAAMRLVKRYGGTPTLTAHSTTNNWDETTTTWDTAPAAGAAAGSAALASNIWTIGLTGVGAFVGTDMSHRLRSNSGTFTEAIPRYLTDDPTAIPRLILTYSIASSSDHFFTSQLRGGATYRLSAFTDVASGSAVMKYNIGAGDVTVNAPAGSGPRLVTATITPATDTTLSGVVPAGISGKVSGLRLTEGINDTGWAPGHKAPCKVAVIDPGQTLSLLADGEQGRSDYSITLREVG